MDGEPPGCTCVLRALLYLGMVIVWVWKQHGFRLHNGVAVTPLTVCISRHFDSEKPLKILTHDFLYKSNSSPSIQDGKQYRYRMAESSNGRSPKSNPMNRLLSSTTSPIATQTQLEEPSPAFHAADVEVAQIVRRRRRRVLSAGRGPSA